MRPVLLGLMLTLLPASRYTLTPSSSFVAIREFAIEAAHSEVGFSIGFLGLPVKGRFDDVKGTIVYAAGAPAASAVSVVIAAASISTGSKHRDEHLRSSDFFDVAKYPTIMFRSRAIEAEADHYVARGALTMHGVTREIALVFRPVSPPIEDPHGSTLLVFTGSARIARRDFGIVGGSKYNNWFDNVRQATMADSVDVSIAVTGWTGDQARIHKYDATLDRIAREGMPAIAEHLRLARAKDSTGFADEEWSLRQVGEALMHRGKLADAVQLFTLMTELLPQSAAAQAALARADELRGDRPAALAAVRRALSLDPTETRAMEVERRMSTP